MQITLAHTIALLCIIFTYLTVGLGEIFSSVFLIYEYIFKNYSIPLFEYSIMIYVTS